MSYATRKCETRDGRLVVAIGEVELTEEQWFDLRGEVDRLMGPVWERRAAEQQAAELAAHKCMMARYQRVEKIGGVAIRVQSAPPGPSTPGDISAWVDGTDTDIDAPFVVRRAAWGKDMARPYIIEGRRHKPDWGQWRRDELTDKRGGTMRFGSIEAAVRKALALELHKDPIEQDRLCG